jgi:hypothetical protein
MAYSTETDITMQAKDLGFCLYLRFWTAGGGAWIAMAAWPKGKGSLCASGWPGIWL